MEKILYIDNFVTKKDIPIVIDYFTKLDIATVENVEFTLHPESEYNACYTDDYPNIYGSLIIYIKEWFSTQTAINFYERLTLNTCKIVYDDPEYFNVYLYSKHFNLELLDSEISHSIEDTTTLNYNDVSLNITSNIDDNSENVEDKEDIFVFESDDEEDEEKYDNKDLDYIYSSDDDDCGDFYKYNKKEKKTKKCNKRKRNINPEVNLDNVNSDVLKSVLIKQNKNYLKNNKSKPYKNVWSRRLRQKQEVNIII